jgi:hypothetical protein
VILQTVKAAVEAGGDLIHAIPPEESSIKRRKDGLALLHNLPIQITIELLRHLFFFSGEKTEAPN